MSRFRTRPDPRRGARRIRRALLLSVVALAAGCSPAPQPIAYGEDVGEHCMMLITDERYGAEIVMETGRVHKFDSIECMAGYYQSQVAEDRVHSLWVTDFQRPGTLIRVEDARILHSPNLRSPMGMNLTAFGEGMTEDAVVHAFAGEIVGWDDVLAMVEDREDHPRPGHESR